MPARGKSDETRAKILAAAMDLFRQKGFAQTTMRDIAAAAEVALGAAYYYFDSKDAIVLAFYDQAQRELEPMLEEALAGSRDLGKRIRALLEVKFRYFEPNRLLLGTLSAYADPNHPLSPFSEQSRPIRENDIRFFDVAIAGSRTSVPRDLRDRLPRLLWLYQMGLILYWIYDRSPQQERTRALVEKSLALVVRLIRIALFPPLRPLRRAVVDLVDTAAVE
jgi:AcrR family transcriptional regulator